MKFSSPLQLSRQFVNVFGAEVYVNNIDRIPNNKRILLVSNHRSVLDAPLIMSVMDRSVRFICHHYMSRVPLLRELISAMGAIPLDSRNQRQKKFFELSVELLKSRQIVGIFPEGAQPMVQNNPPNQLCRFHRGFAHLALQAPVDDLVILPVAIESAEEKKYTLAPLKLFSLLDPSEPLFRKGGWHSAIVYKRVHLHFGSPIAIGDEKKCRYRGQNGFRLAEELSQLCSEQINGLLGQGNL
jgi:1-acyl-sn-glycerol-3-phosphate acyltransferase